MNSNAWQSTHGRPASACSVTPRPTRAPEASPFPHPHPPLRVPPAPGNKGGWNRSTYSAQGWRSQLGARRRRPAAPRSAAGVAAATATATAGTGTRGRGPWPRRVPGLPAASGAGSVPCTPLPARGPRPGPAPSQPATSGHPPRPATPGPQAAELKLRSRPPHTARKPLSRPPPSPR